jgi:translation initiation factor 2 alpha subunit (eIF-2alpha)
MKQETLEEFAEKVSRAFDNDNYKALMDLVKEGANWQAERMYSEEEVRNIVEQTIEKFYKHRYVETKSEMKELWFEQFKKK